MGVQRLRLGRSGVVRSQEEMNPKGTTPAERAALACALKAKHLENINFLALTSQLSFNFQGICDMIPNDRGFPNL